MPVFIAVLIAVAIIFVFVGLALPLFASDPVQSRLTQFADRPRSLEEMELEQPFNERILRPFAQRMAGIAERFNRNHDRGERERQTNSIQQRLTLAGNPHRWTPTEFLGVKIITALVFGGLTFLLLSIVGQVLFAPFAGAGLAL